MTSCDDKKRVGKIQVYQHYIAVKHRDNNVSQTRVF